jgi:hypothetical protein
MSKRKINLRKKYANGTNAKGMDPANYIISPAEAMNDYNIMLGKAEAEAVSNPWLPIVAMAGQALQTGIGIAGKFAGKKAEENVDTEDTEATAAMGMNNVQGDVEVEGGEMYETPQGQVGEFQGPNHEQGGIPLEVGEDVEEGTKVYSDRLKVGNKTLAERKASREKQITNLEKIAQNGLADVAVKNAAKRKMEAIQKEEMQDLQFQEQVNNMQTMADTMVMAFGTGMKGMQNYAMGTGADGVYVNGTDKNGIENPELDVFGNPIITPKGFAEGFGLDSEGYTGEMYKESLGNNPNINYEALKNFKIGEGINDNASLSYGDPYAEDGVNFKMPSETIMTPVDQYGKGVDSKNAVKEPGAFSEALKEMSIPGVGDMTKLIGNYLGMTSGIKTAAEQRSTDVTHTNVFANVGKESQRLLDNAKQGIETSKAQAVVKASDVSRGGKRGARGSARGVNQMRAMDWLYDTALQEQIAQISANAAGQISQIDTQKSGVAMSADQLKGQGEFQAAMANEAAKDAYYTALGQGRKDFATGMQQTGKDVNDMKQNKMISKLMKKYGKYVSLDDNMKLVAANENKSADSTDVITIGKQKFKLDENGNYIKIA